MTKLTENQYREIADRLIRQRVAMDLDDSTIIDQVRRRFEDIDISYITERIENWKEFYSEVSNDEI